MHDLTAACAHGLVGAPGTAGVDCFADKGQGAGRTIQLPFRGKRRDLSRSQQAVNAAHAKIRAAGEQAVATLKDWRVLRKLRCSTTRITALVQAILTLHYAAT